MAMAMAMTKACSASCLMLIAAICLLQSPLLTCANKTFVLSTCNNTADANLCSQILLSNPRSVNATSVAELASIALDMAVQSAEAAASQASGLSDRYQGLPEEEVLDMCQELLSEATDDLRDAQTEAAQQNYMHAGELANNAQDDADSCEKAFTDKEMKSLMSDQDRALHDRSGLAADILDLLDVP
jgi:pectinesterase inhibitor-like protein